MKRNARRWLIGAVFLIVLLQTQFFGGVYWGDAIEATVIDAETKQPLEGVNVVANWPLTC